MNFKSILILIIATFSACSTPQNHKKGIRAFEGNIASQQAKDLYVEVSLLPRTSLILIPQA